MHGPAPLPPNTATIGVGLAPMFLEGPIDEDFLLFNLIFGLYANGRYGITERLEVGASAGFFNGLSADVKYNLIPGPLFVSAALAGSVGLVVDIFGDSDDVDVLGIHPALLVGTERIYGGAKLMAFPFSAYVRRPWTVVFVGGSFGGDFRIVPEIGWLRDPADGETSWIGGLVVQRRIDLF